MGALGCTVPLLCDHGAIAGTYSGSSPASLPCTGHVAAGTSLILCLAGAGNWTPATTTDTKGNAYWAGSSYAGMVIVTGEITTALAPGDAITFPFHGATTAAFTYHSVQVAGISARDGDPGNLGSIGPPSPILDNQLGTNFSSLASAAAGPYRYGCAVAVHFWPSPTTPPTITDNLDWITLHNDGHVIVGYAVWNHLLPTAEVIPRGDFQTVGTSGDVAHSVAVNYHATAQNLNVNSAELEFGAPAVLVSDSTYDAGGKRVDVDYVMSQDVTLDAGSASGVCNSGDTVYQYPPWNFEMQGGHILDIPGAPIGPAHPTVPGEMNGGVLPDATKVLWPMMLQLWPVDLPSDQLGPEANADRMELTVYIRTTLSQAKSKPCGGAETDVPLAEGTATYIPATPTSALETGDVLLDGAVIATATALRYDGVLGAHEVGFRMISTPPSLNTPTAPMPDLWFFTLSEGVFNQLVARIRMHLTLWFPAAPPSPPIHVAPLPEEGPDVGGGTSTPIDGIRGSATAGAGSVGEVR